MMMRNFTKLFVVGLLVISTSGCATTWNLGVDVLSGVISIPHADRYKIDKKPSTPASKPRPATTSSSRPRQQVVQQQRVTQKPRVVQPKPSKPAPPAHPPRGNINISKKKTQFLISEIERTVKILSSEFMTDERYRSSDMFDPRGQSSNLLAQGTLISWFDLERPESQAIYYRLIGIPMAKDTRLTRTKSEFYNISEKTRNDLRNYLVRVLKDLRQEVSWQKQSNTIGVHESSLP